MDQILPQKVAGRPCRNLSLSVGLETQRPRSVYGITVTNRHRAHFDPLAGIGCPFCEQQETVFHSVVNCTRLMPLFDTLGRCCQKIEVFMTEC